MPSSGIRCISRLAVLLAVRIVNEEKLLTADLAGYDDNRRRVRYRLVLFMR